ncbi:MAG: hypothetical protein ABS95_03945 [Verrucomicrobia bacterium SCN 57-15]|jgi:hypothetical protein|nr:MAG: hypothetical protein ABS95_03945 [Verrucomicrobia bacterium SCN 57-15]
MPLLFFLLIAFVSTFSANAALPILSDGLVYATNGSGVFGYKDTPKLPWCGYLVHDPDRPAPIRVDPGPAPAPAPIPADAIVLFNGNDLSQWNPTQWLMKDGEMIAHGGGLSSRESFGDIQLHLEWMAPADYKGPWYNQGNNGVVLMGLYEIQIFDSYNIKWAPDGQAAAVYAQTPPLVNACRKPGEWQTYDIVFTAPKYDGDKLIAPPRITMHHNGVLVHLNQEIYGETGHRVLPGHRSHKTKGPLMFAGHDCPVHFRNIWIRKL